MTMYIPLRDSKPRKNEKIRSWKFYVLILAALLLLIPIALIGFIFVVRKPGEIRFSMVIRHPNSEIIQKLSKNFDFLLFTQLYPISDCILFKQEAEGNQCHYASNKKAWSIHGIWPSTFGTIGPEYCKREYFDPDKVQSIRSELDIHWSSIKPNGNEDFWKHEWLKHGSCAEQLPTFDDELKYFSQGLAWNKQYNINEMFEEAGIIPNNSRSFKIDEFHAAVIAHTGFKPLVGCILDEKNNLYLLNEIRLCFNKSNYLESCNNLEKEDECPEDGIIYPEDNYINSFL